MFRPWIRGVIACGAGFPSGMQPPNYRFDYFGIVGLGDFNLTEMTELDQSLDYLKMRHFILDYDGIHAWAGTKQFDMALCWHLLNLSRDGKIRKNDSLVSAVYNTVLADEDSLVKAGRLLYARQSLAYGISCLEGLTKTDGLKTKLEQLEKDERYLTAVKTRNNILDKEKKEQQQLMEAMFSKDQKWWQGKLAKLRDNRRPGLSPEDTLMNRRLIAFLGLLCYSNASALVRQHQDSQAKGVLAIYAMVEPDNPEPYYVLAVIAASENDQVTALAMLEKSYERGFRNVKRAQSQPEFSILKDNKGYFDFIRKIQ
jgi:hypothetical protein